MTPLKLRLQNFRSFRKMQEFTFPQGPGLFFLWGENREEPALEANGSGKSSLWEALVWLFFGKTSGGLKAGDAANWDVAKQSFVELDYRTDAGVFTIHRSWAPIRWILTDPWMVNHDLSKDESNPVKELLRLDFQPFLNAVMMAQGEPMFLDLKSEPKAALFAAVMDLDQWLAYSTKAGKKATEKDAECRRIERELAGIEGSLEQLDGAPLEKLFDDWANTQIDRRKAVELEYAELIERDGRLRLALKKLEAEEAVARKALKDALLEVDARAEDITELAPAVKDATRTLDKADHLVDLASEQISQVSAQTHCQACGQDITEAHRRRRVVELNKALGDAKEAAHEASEAQVQAKATLLKAELAWEGARKRARTAQAATEDAAGRVRGVRSDYEALGAKLDALEDLDERLAGEVNPYAALLDQHDESRQALRSDRTHLRRRLEDVDAEFRLATSWVKWFKEIRLGLISEALDQLEIEVNSCVNALGLQGWELRFEVDRETKSGSIQRGFNVFVQSPHNQRAVPWESWSGGESQRLRLATQQGLGNLIRQRTGTQFNLEVWDEPTQWMSAQGVTDLLDSLAQRAEVEQRQIWIVDHRTLGYSKFTGTCGVIKTEAGSHFNQSGLYISTQPTPEGEPHVSAAEPARTRTRRRADR